jgi:hypothetical protein
MPTDYLRLPVVSAGAEHLVMGYLMSRNIHGGKALNALATSSAEREAGESLG